MNLQINIHPRKENLQLISMGDVHRHGGSGHQGHQGSRHGHGLAPSQKQGHGQKERHGHVLVRKEVTSHGQGHSHKEKQSHLLVHKEVRGHSHSHGHGHKETRSHLLVRKEESSHGHGHGHGHGHKESHSHVLVHKEEHGRIQVHKEGHGHGHKQTTWSWSQSSTSIYNKSASTGSVPSSRKPIPISNGSTKGRLPPAPPVVCRISPTVVVRPPHRR